MSAEIIGVSQPAPYDDEEEIQLMDTDETNLQLDEQLIDTNINENKDDKQIEEEEEEKVPSLLVIEVCFIRK
jgi:hypothetical protein